VKMKAEEPQSYRDLALVYTDQRQYQKAIDLFNKVIIQEWPIRFQHIEDEVIMEMNRALWLAKKNEVSVDISSINNKFIEHMPVDVKLTIAWDTDDCCIDLHITEPTGTKSYYGNHCTEIGGWSTPDYPGCPSYSTSMLREYMIKIGMPGKYTVNANYYSNYRQDLTGGTTVWFTIFTNYATELEQRTSTVVRLGTNSVVPSNSSQYEIGTMEYGTNKLVQSWVAEWGKNIDHNKKLWEEYQVNLVKRDEEWRKFEKDEMEIIASNEEMIKAANETLK